MTTARLLHLSDTHFGTERGEVRDALIMLAHDVQPHAMVLSGDLTQRATHAQFDAAAAFVAELPRVPLLVIPGNHDIPLFNLWLRFTAPHRRYARHFGATIDRSWRGHGVHLIGVDTTRRWRQQHGALSHEQIAQTAAHLRGADPAHWRIVVTHHPLVVTRDVDAADRPLNYAAGLRSWADAGADLLLCGHIHLPAVLRWYAPSGAAMWVANAGSAVSQRTLPGVPNSVNVLEQVRQAGLTRRRVQRWDFDAQAGRFVLRATHALDGVDSPEHVLDVPPQVRVA